jgi:hypothetical protein
MARTTIEINEDLKAVITANLAAVGITIDPAIWSDANRVRQLVYSFSYAANKLETLFDNHVSDVDEMLRNRKAPSRQWYRNLILNFQYGFPLYTETDVFDNTGYTQQQIDDSKVIKYCRVIKQINVYGRVKLLLKIAGSNGTDLVQTTQDVVDALFAYLDADGVLPAGDNWEIVARPSDKIKQKWRIYYDPKILDANGNRKDGTANEPVRAAIIAFLKDGVPFSGTYVLNFHSNAIEKVPGVVIPEILETFVNYGATPFVPVNTEYEPDGGWLRFDTDTDLEIEYVVHNAF